MGETKYVLLEAMSQEDIDYNVHRLRRKGHTAHADALEEYGRKKFGGEPSTSVAPPARPFEE